MPHATGTSHEHAQKVRVMRTINLDPDNILLPGVEFLADAERVGDMLRLWNEYGVAFDVDPSAVLLFDTRE
jgi:hypothetical protein